MTTLFDCEDDLHYMSENLQRPKFDSGPRFCYYCGELSLDRFQEYWEAPLETDSFHYL